MSAAGSPNVPLKRLWAGETVTFRGAYTRVSAARMGFTPYQTPHPPLEMGAQSVGATRRAARLVDAVFFGPQVSWADVGRLVSVYREARGKETPGTPGTAYASRSLSAYLVYRLADPAAQAEAARFSGNSSIRFEYTVISNIYAGGLPPLEAAALIVERAAEILVHRAAGNRLEARRKTQATALA